MFIELAGHCCVTNYMQWSGLEQHIYYLTVSVHQESGYGSGLPALVSHRMQGIGRGCSHVKASLGLVCWQVHSGDCWQDAVATLVPWHVGFL